MGLKGKKAMMRKPTDTIVGQPYYLLPPPYKTSETRSVDLAMMMMLIYIRCQAQLDGFVSCPNSVAREAAGTRVEGGGGGGG